MVPIFHRLNREEKFTHSIILADMHLSSFFGNTINEVICHSKNIYPLETLMHSDSKLARTKSLGIGIMGISELLAQIKPDVFFVLGDRGEVLAATICAMEMNIPIAHLFGGDVCQGGVDEPVRHAITKLANIHFASNHESADRIVKMGEESWRVHMVGSPVLDLVAQKRFTSAPEIEAKFDLDLSKPILLLLQHSVTWQVEAAEQQIRATLEAIDQFKYQTIAVYPCSDPGYETIIKVLQEYSGKPYFRLYRNIDFPDFWGLMNVSAALVGNSSAGVMETASFKIPFINIGIRQEGRLRAGNVIDVAHDTEQIVQAIRTALFDPELKGTLARCVSPYGDGNAAQRIVEVLKCLPPVEKLITKKMTY